MVSREDDQASVVTFFSYGVENDLLTGKIESGNGFVKQDDRRIAGQSGGDVNPLTLAKRQGAIALVEDLTDLKALSGAGQGGVVLIAKTPEQSLSSQPLKGQDLPGAERHPCCRLLPVADACHPGTGSTPVHLPLKRGVKTGDHVEQRCLSRTVWANEGDQGPRIEGDIGDVEGNDGPVSDRHLVERKHHISVLRLRTILNRLRWWLQ